MKGGVRKRGNSWYYYFDYGIVEGKRKKIERLAEGASTKSEAQTVLRRKIIEYENVGMVFKPSEITLHDYLNYWMQEYVELKLKLNTQYNYETTIRIHISPALGKYKLKALTPEVLQKFVNDKVREGFARKTVEIMMGILNKALRHAVYPYKYINENPMQYVELMMDTLKKQTREDLKIQSNENLRLLNNHISVDSDFYVPFHIGMNIGLRVGETCGLEWSKIDFEEKTIEVDQQLIGEKKDNGRTEWIPASLKSKAGYRTIAVGDNLLDLLRKEKIRQKQNRLKYGEYYIKSDRVCVKENGQPLTPSIIKYHTRIISQKLNLKFNYHSLRHTLATKLIENGLPTKTVQKILGHSRASITEDRYVHLTEKMQRNAADVMDMFTKEL
ncbi:site-specific integrase [Psychrobacillus sp. FSL K6-2365]|uniref:tyrosine-type recombinase/integrase n=1 Tax=Psychrobacillus sp. FSL K6-2365 TaxID=2921546 RepID=UPI0030F7ECAF